MSQIFYVDSDTLSGADNSDIGSWVDTVGGFNLSSLGNSQKLFNNVVNGHAVMRWNQVGGYTSALSASTQPFTFAIVFNPSDVSGSAFFDGNGSSGGAEIGIDGSQKIFFNKSGLVAIAESSTTISTSTWYAVLVTYDGSGNWAIYVNSATAEVSGSNVQTFTGSLTTRFGADFGGGSLFKGDMAQMRKFNAALGSTDITGWFNTVAAKYGITLH